MNEPALGPQRAVRTMDLNIRGEERERKREVHGAPRCVCNKRGDTRVPSLSPLLLLFFLLPRFLLRRREQREHRAWMEEQCTPYINIVPITRSPGGYRSSKMPANFGRQLERLSLLVFASRLLSCCALSRMKKRGRDRTKRWPVPVIYGGSRPNFEMVSFPRDYSLPRSAVVENVDEISIVAREKFRKILIRNGVEMDNSSKIQSIKAVL